MWALENFLIRVWHAGGQEAQAARDRLNGYSLDKNHTFAVFMFDDFDKYGRVPEQYQAPDKKEYQPAVRSPCTVSRMPCLLFFHCKPFLVRDGWPF